VTDHPSAPPPPPTEVSPDDEAVRGVTRDWGFPRFAEGFPRHPELDALVLAFTRGDYRSVRERAPVLAREATDEEVQRAARTLRARIDPDPTASIFFVATALLLGLLTVWWVGHDGPPPDAPAPRPTVEIPR
jgi:hypothetical protein